MTQAPDPRRFETHTAEVRNGVTIAYVHEGVGGLPMLLLHGYPESKRIWWRNIGALAEAGFLQWESADTFNKLTALFCR